MCHPDIKTHPDGTKSDGRRLQAAELRFLKGIEKATRKDRMKKQIIRDSLKVTALKYSMKRVIQH